MPVATVKVDDTEKFILKSIRVQKGEEPAYVVLKRMTYGQKLTRAQSSSKMSIAMQKGKKDIAGQMEMMQVNAAIIDFRTCIVEHNLTDVSGRKLNFGSPEDMSILDPRVGEEIASYLDKLNNFEEDDEEGNSLSASV